MSVLVVDYGAIEGLNRTAGSLTRKLQKTIDDYEGIAKAINSLPSPRSNLDNANYFIRKKAEQNQTKIDKLNAFKTRMIGFSDLVDSTDKKVANRITSETKEFKKANDISISPLVVIGNAVTTVLFPWTKTPLGKEIKNWIEKGIRDIKYSFKDWYRKDGNKYLTKVLLGLAAIAIIAAVVIVTVATGGSALALLGATFAAKFFAVFTLASAASAFAYDVAALINYNRTGDRTSSNWLDKKGGSHVLGSAFGAAGYGLGYVLGGKNSADEFKKIGKKFGKMTFSGLEIASVVYSFWKTGAGIYKFAKNFSTIKNMGMMQGKSNWEVLKKTVMAKSIGSDLKLKIGSSGVYAKLNITKDLFGKSATYKKAFFNLGVHSTVGLFKELDGNGFVKGLKKKTDKVIKESLKIGYLAN